MGFPGKSIDEMVMEETDANGMNGESNSEEEGESSNSDDSDNEAGNFESMITFFSQR